jgi:hypothetical protein
LEYIDRDETAGIDWLAANDTKTVSLRHAPELAPGVARGHERVRAVEPHTVTSTG